MAINRVDVSVADLGALAQLHVSELEDGSWEWVASERAYFSLVKSSGAVADGLSIVAPIAGSPSAGGAGARWVKVISGAQEQFALQPDWYHDPINGNDNNTGLTAITALETHEELVTRIGDQIINQ